MTTVNAQQLLTIAKSCFEFISPKLNSYTDFTESLSQVIKVKQGENIQYSFDVELDNLIKEQLQSISAKVFSEESGWFETQPDFEFKIIYDPFCNSSLASRSFREAAMGLSVFQKDNTWLSSLVLDYQTGLVGFAEVGQNTKFFQIQSGQEIILNKKIITKIQDAWTVLTIEDQTERQGMSQVMKIMESTKRLIVSSGHIYWLKLAMGTIDAYLDPIGGEKLYEMFAATVAQHAGCKVTDKSGVDFDSSQMLTQFEKDGNYIYYPIAATNPTLHQSLLI